MIRLSNSQKSNKSRYTAEKANDYAVNLSMSTAGVWGGRNPPQYLGARGKHPPIQLDFQPGTKTHRSTHAS